MTALAFLITLVLTSTFYFGIGSDLKSSIAQGGLSEQQDTSCQHSYQAGNLLQHDKQYAASYDTLKAFVERCPTYAYAPAAFEEMAGDVGKGGDGTLPAALSDFQQWLISALAWNPGNATYFCMDVHALMQTFGTTDTGWVAGNTITNKGLSVLHWLLHNPLCFNSSDSELYVNSRGSQYETYLNWPGLNRDTVPFDTTLYSLHDLGLDSVLKYASLLGVSENGPSIITNASAYPNPTGEGTVLVFGTAKEAYVIANLYDVLGNAVGSVHFENVMHVGNHEVPLSLAGLLSGTYFARIQTTYGEVESVKIVKQ